MTDLWVSLSVLAAAVLLCEATRRAAAPLLGEVYRLYLLETVSTFQLCCCTHELKLLAQTGGLAPPGSAALTYTITVVHLFSFRGATCNPSAALESVCRGARSVRAAVLLMAFQFGAAAAARVFAASAWSLGLSDMHLRHQKFGFRCFDPLGGTVLEAAAVELACAFTVQAAAMHAHKLQETLRVPFVAAVITAVVYTGGSVSGAVFNPALAFSVQFPCSGHSYLEYCFIYWLGPVLGTASCVLLLEKIVPFLSGKSSAVQKRKTQ
ncbi:aquaporin-11-like [Nematolebias whitei]|uniref:aquaporin-11-like n=1 Tax=Nematolebias whitei TaxID=451745 RepID=UPI001898610B|nr:aquaporin-11-like [Nematolebias whitei]